MRGCALGLAALVGCSDYALDDDGKAPFDTGTPLPDESGETAVEETCNGVDDNGDGRVDEGFDDVDADGTADCVDDACAVSEPAAREEHDLDCADLRADARAPERPWEVVVEWEAPTNGTVSTPAVGDLDHDGIPEVAFVSYDDGGQLVVLDGATGVEEWRVGGPELHAGAAVGDIDGDGWGDVVVPHGQYGAAHVVDAWDHEGNALWTGRIGVSFYAHPAIGDPDRDGAPEVLVNEYVLDGATGAEEARMDVSGGTNFGASSFADVDLDGVDEVIVAGGVFSLDGTLRFWCGGGGEVETTIVAQLDDDPEAEVINGGLYLLTVCDTDGGVLWTRSTASWVGTMAALDIDGDGVQELALPDQSELRLLRADGSEVWAAPIEDPSGASGVVVWDVDLDGAPEIFYRDERAFRIFDGLTGEEHVTLADRTSWTSWDTPAVADIDGDGAGEVVFGTSPTSPGAGAVVAVGSADGDWPPARPVYNQAAFTETNIADDLSVPAEPEPSWLLAGGVFRGQISAIDRLGLPNARVEITDGCVASCEDGGLVTVVVQVWNDGEQALPADLVLTVTGADGVVYEAALGEEVPPAGSVTRTVRTTVAAAGGLLVATVDPAGTVEECHEDDGEASWVVRGCG